MPPLEGAWPFPGHKELEPSKADLKREPKIGAILCAQTFVSDSYRQSVCYRRFVDM